MNILTRIFCLFIVLLGIQYFTVPSASAEGTKEIMPIEIYQSRLSICPDHSNFAFNGASFEDRLHIHIDNIGEKIYYGFGEVTLANQNVSNDLYVVIKNPNGVVVVSSILVPASGAGFIPTYQKACDGPSIINPSGYNALSYQANMVGDYYMEFYFLINSSSSYDRREIEYFDITVASPTNVPIKGRIWSKEWQFTTTLSNGANAFLNPFYGQLYMYSKDSIVTKVDFNGVRPYVFSVAANSTGTSNTGNALQDRKSVIGKSTYPEHKIFINDPDSIVYPSGIIGAFTAPMTFSGCPGQHCINVHTNTSASIQLLIDLNGVYGYQAGTEDVLIVQNVNSGTSCINWSGINGLGQQVLTGAVIDFYATMGSGLTHMPLYDVEHNPGGFKINLVRPTFNSSQFNLYWDDSNIPNSTAAPSGGCVSTLGCHDFPFMFGDEKTINTWWYAVTDIKDSLHFVYDGLHIDSIAITPPSCYNTSDGIIEVFTIGGTNPIAFSSNGLTYQISTQFDSLAPNTYSITVRDSNNCIQSDTVVVISPPPVTQHFAINNDTCNMSQGSILSLIDNGNGPYKYQWSTSVTDTLSSLQNILKGMYTVTIYDKNNCHFSFTDSISNNPSLLAIQATVLHDTCSNGQGKIVLNLTNGAQPYQYIWSTVPAQNQAIAQNLSSGTYWVTITENGFCTHTDSFQIQDMPPPLPDFIFAKDACLENLMLLTYNGNNIPPDNYNWDFANATHISGQGKGPHELKFQNTGPHTIKLNVNKLGCPSDSVQHIVNIHDLIINNDSIRNVSCPGENNGFVAFSVTDGLPPYQISCATTGINSLNNLILKSGNHQVYISDSIGCTDSIIVVITEPLPIEGTLDIQKTSCTYSCDGSIGIATNGGTKPYHYKWDFPLQTTDSLVTDLCAGNYSVVVTDSNKCKDTIHVKMDYAQDINADFTSSVPFGSPNLQNFNFTFTGYGASNYDWNFGGIGNSNLANPSFLFPEAKEYEVLLIVNSGAPYFCVDSIKRLIEAIPPYDIFIPNAFTPNGNGVNDRYMIYANGIKEYHIQIFNRWGEMIYESNDIESGWNGKVKGVEAPLSVYVYVIEVLTIKDKQHLKIGTFTLVR